MSRRRASLAALVLSLSAAPAASQQRIEVAPTPSVQAWRVDSFAQDAGLTEGYVYQVAVDDDGTAWFATSRGLYRYHGYVWERFTTRHGLPSELVRCVTVTSAGKVWAGTDAGAGVFRDERFELLAPPESLSGPSVRRIAEGPDGALWFCCDRWPDASVQSGLTRLLGGEWRSFGERDGLPSSYVSDVAFDSGGAMYVLTEDGLALREGERFRQPLVHAGVPGADDYMWSVVEPTPGELLVASTRGYFRREGGTWRRIADYQNGVEYPALLRTSDGEVLCLRQTRECAFVRWTGAGFEAATDPFPWTGQSVQDLAEGPDGAVWAVGGGLILRWDRRAASSAFYPDLPPPVLVDAQSGIWFADARRVVRRLGDAWWSFPGARGSPVADDVGGIWMAARGGVARWSAGEPVRRSPDLPADVSLERLIGVDGSGTLWGLGRDAESWLALGLAEERWRVEPLSARTNRAPLFACDPAVGGLWAAVAEPPANRLVRVAVDPAASLEVELPVEARHAETPRVARTRDGAVWVYGLFGAFRRESPQAGDFERVRALPLRHVQGIHERDDALWLIRLSSAGGSSGLSLRTRGEWSHRDLEVRRLVGWAADGGPIFVRADRLYRMQPATLEQEHVFQLRVPGEVEAVVVDDSGDLWLGTDGGVHHVSDDGYAPDTTILEVADEIPSGEDLLLRVRGYERYRPLDRTSSFQVEIRVDDGPWQDFGQHDEGPIAVPLPGAGEHRLAVRVVDSSGHADPVPAVAPIRVLPVPLQSRSWFTPVLVAVFAIVVALAAFGLSARHRLSQQAKVLADLVEERTRAWQGTELEYRTLFEESRDAIVLCDAEGRVQDANRAAVELFALDAAALGRERIPDLFDEPLDLANVGAAGSAPVRLTRDAGAKHVFLSATARRDEEDATTGYLAIARDVTRQVELEEQLSHTQKMEAIGRLAGGVAHEFNNILTGILGYSELLAAEVASQPELSQKVDLISEQAERAMELTGQIQTFSRVDLTRTQVIEVNAVVARTEKLLRPLLDRAIELEYSLDPRVGRARMEAGKLEQVVVNLVLNAADAMPDGGLILVHTRPAGADAQAWLLTVADDGAGMDEETRRKVFEPFFTTKPAGKGTGLGLAIVYGIVDQVGGAIGVTSTPGAGTVFRVTLPATDDPVAPARSPAPAGARDRQAGRILVVDDEDSIRSFLRTLLEREGYDVTLAADAKEARAILESTPERFDLVITDLVMPGTRGRDVVGGLRRADPDLPIVLMSGQPDAEAGEAVVPSPQLAFLPKPFGAQRLLPLVRQMIDARERASDVTV